MSFMKTTKILFGILATTMALVINGRSDLATPLLTGFDQQILDRNDDGSTGLVPIGFAINFYGKRLDTQADGSPFGKLECVIYQIAYYLLQGSNRVSSKVAQEILGLGRDIHERHRDFTAEIETELRRLVAGASNAG